MAFPLRSAAALAVIALTTLPAAASAHGTHVVKPGETLSGIAAANRVTTGTLAAANGLSETSFVIAGRTLTVPDQGTTPPSGAPAPLAGYRVRLNDTLSGVAARHGVSISALAAANGLTTASQLTMGRTLRIPQGATAVSATPTSTGTTTAAVRIVRPGETLWGIAASLGVTPSALAAANGVSAEHRVIAGASLRVPARGTTVASTTTATKTTTAKAAPATSSTGPVGSGGRLTAAQIGQIAAQYGVPSDLATAIAWQESGFNNAMVSVANARGIMQIMPTTWTYVQNELGAGPLSQTSATDNVRAGSILLRQLLREAGGDQTIATAAYYQGMSSVRRIGLLPETRAYVTSVMALRARFR